MSLEDLRKKHYSELTSSDWGFLKKENIVNGCGGKGESWKERFFRWAIRKVLKTLRLIFIEASCLIHDFTYWQGGDEKRRTECDKGFFVKIIGDIEKIELSFFGTIGYTALALVFYGLVRIGGKYYFNYRNLG